MINGSPESAGKGGHGFTWGYGSFRSSVTPNSPEYEIIMAMKRQGLSRRQAVADYEKFHPQPVQQDEISPAVHNNTVSEEPARAGKIKVYRFHRQGDPAPSWGGGRSQVYGHSEALQLYPKDENETLTGLRAEEAKTTATFHATFMSSRVPGKQAVNYWGVTDNRNGQTFTVSIDDDLRLSYRILADFVEEREKTREGGNNGQDVTIFVN